MQSWETWACFFSSAEWGYLNPEHSWPHGFTPVQSRIALHLEGPTLDLMLCCCHIEILNSILTKGPTLSFHTRLRVVAGPVHENDFHRLLKEVLTQEKILSLCIEFHCHILRPCFLGLLPSHTRQNRDTNWLCSLDREMHKTVDLYSNSPSSPWQSCSGL